MEVCDQAVTSTCIKKLDRVRHEMLLRPLHINPDVLKESLGAVVNLNNEHWVALRWIDGAVRLLDSMGEPESFSWSEYLKYIAEHRSAYPIVEVAVQSA